VRSARDVRGARAREPYSRLPGAKARSRALFTQHHRCRIDAAARSEFNRLNSDAGDEHELGDAGRRRPGGRDSDDAAFRAPTSRGRRRATGVGDPTRAAREAELAAAGRLVRLNDVNRVAAIHQRTHTHACGLCGKGFSGLGHLENHIDGGHAGRSLCPGTRMCVHCRVSYVFTAEVEHMESRRHRVRVRTPLHVLTHHVHSV